MSKFFFILFFSFLFFQPLCGQTSGLISTIAGNGTGGNGGDGGLATDAQLNTVMCIAFNKHNELYILDAGNYVIRKINSAGVISRVAGNGVNTVSGDGGPAISAGLGVGLRGMVIDKFGSIYFSASNRIRKIDTLGMITTIAGTGSLTYGGDGGPATLASGNFGPMVLDSTSTQLYVGDISNNRVRLINLITGTINTIAGNGTNGYSSDGVAANTTPISHPMALALDKFGDLIIGGDPVNGVQGPLFYRIRKVNSSGIISTFAGAATGTTNTSGNGGPAIDAMFKGVYGLSFDKIGNLYICDKGSYEVRKIDAFTGTITKVAGTGFFVNCYNGDGIQADSAKLCNVSGITPDAFGNILFCDGNRIRSIVQCTLPGIINQPKNDTVCMSNNAKFTIQTCRASLFQWQENTGSGFVNITSNSTYLGTTTSNLIIKNVSSAMNGYVYRCVVQDSVPITSSTADLIVQSLSIPTISIIYTSTVCSGSPDTLVASISGGTSPFHLNWSDGATTSTNVIHPLIAGNNNYVLNVTDANGCEAWKSTTILVNPLPLIHIGGNTILCNGINDTLKATGGVSYVWSTGATTQSIVTNIVGTYSVLGTDINGCVNDDYLVMFDSCNVVWPGDANNDLMVNGSDVLQVAWATGINGPSRSSASITWTGQSAPNWPSGVDKKYIDCDGNGAINLNDTVAIIQNYGLSHSALKPSNSATTTAGIPIRLKPNQNAISAGGNLTLDVLLGDTSFYVSSLYGIAFTVQFDNNLIDENTIRMNANNSWMGYTNSDLIVVTLKKPGTSMAEFVISKTNHNGVTNFGKIGEITCKAAGNFSLIANTGFTITSATPIRNDNTIIPTFLGLAQTNVSIVGPEGIISYNNDNKISAFPNPTTGRITILSKDREAVSIFDSTGSLVSKTEKKSDVIEIDLSQNPDGIYFVKTGSSVLKIIKTK